METRWHYPVIRKASERKLWRREAVDKHRQTVTRRPYQSGQTGETGKTRRAADDDDACDAHNTYHTGYDADPDTL